MFIGRFKAFRVNHRARTMAESMELGEITLEKFRLWTPEALKYYLSIRKRSVTGSFDELVARLVKKNLSLDLSLFPSSNTLCLTNSKIVY